MAARITNRFYRPRHWTLAQILDHHTDKSGGPDACWPWTGVRRPDGYGVLWWKGRLWRAHCRAWINANGPIQPDKPHILHKCDVPACVNPDHLWAGTNADNIADKVAKGRARGPYMQGEAHPNAKLTEDDVRAIMASTETHTAIATRFGVCLSTVGNIRSGKGWKHI